MAPRPLSGLLVLLFLLAFASVGAALGVSFGPQLLPQLQVSPGPCPLPHHVPKYPGVASLRFAMVHDVLSERYPKHGRAYYEERNRRTRLALKEEDGRMARSDGKPTRRYFELIDDLGVGLDLLGRHAESVALLRDKLKRQQALGHEGMDLYPTYANLGTFIILWEIHEGFADKEKAKAGLNEGLKLIHQAIAINPRSHFGREIWQAVILEYLLAMLEDPELVVQFDMVGNALGETGSGRSWNPRGWSGQCAAAFAYLQKPEAEQDAARLAEFRHYITQLYPDARWKEKVKASQTGPVPFDEPTLGIIGMWRLGGGPNPFFAVALGEIMLRVGQAYTAWNAYERAYLLADALGPETVRDKFKQHCRLRQERIEKALPVEDVPRLRPSFAMHLQKGMQYQQAYQEYEQRRIREGAALGDPRFYDAFDAEHGSIASPVGDEDRFLPDDDPSKARALPLLLLGAGIFACAGVLIIRAGERCCRAG
jgi:hypothetical protein